MEISRLLKFKKKTKKALASYVGISTDSIIGYEKGTHQPPLDVCIKMADFLNCSLETLAGIKETVVDLKMLNAEKKALVQEVLNMDAEDVSKVSSFIAGIKSTKK